MAIVGKHLNKTKISLKKKGSGTTLFQNFKGFDLNLHTVVLHHLHMECNDNFELNSVIGEMTEK